MRGVRNVHGAKRTSAAMSARPMSADWSSDISSAEASAMKSQNAVTSHQKLDKRQRSGSETRPGSATLGCIGGSFIFPLRDDAEPLEVSRILPTLTERRCEVTRQPRFPSRFSPDSSRFTPAPSQPGNFIFGCGV